MDRPLERRNATRTAVVWDAVRDLLGDGAGERRVLDIGGGTGGLAVHVAGLGHRVTVVDPSPDALATLARRAADDGVADRVVAVQGDLDTLPDLAPDLDPSYTGEQGYDLVLCHGVLGLVADVDAALAAIAAVLRPGGVLSLVVGQHHAAVVARAMAGHFAQARELLEGGAGQVPTGRGAERRFAVGDVRALATRAGLEVTAVHGVRVFTDLVPSSLLDLEPGAAASLLELERAVAERPEYLSLAGQLHVIAVR